MQPLASCALAASAAGGGQRAPHARCPHSLSLDPGVISKELGHQNVKRHRWEWEAWSLLGSGGGRDVVRLPRDILLLQVESILVLTLNRVP